MGSTSTVQCLFHRDFFAVLWFNTTNYPEEDPILRYQNMKKYGAGYNSGEFDIHPNGSLIINHVLLSHEHTFKVGYAHFDSEVPTLIDVQIIVTVNPPIPFPVLENCGNATNKCYSEIDRPFIECSVRGSRPPVLLNLILRTVSGDRDISNETLTLQNGVGYTSRVTTKNLFDYSSILVLLVCKASGPPGILSEDESLALVQRSEAGLKSLEPTRVHVARNSVMELKCTGHQVGFLLWKKISSPSVPVQEILMYTVFIERKFTELFSSDFSLGTNGSLKTFISDLRHEGSYFCLFGDGETDGVTMYEVSIIVHPVPAYPVIDGCAHDECCVLEAEREGNLTCSVTGIRPMVQLEWGGLSAQDVTTISFTKHNFTVKDNGETFDLTLTAMYNILEYQIDRVTVECRISLPEVFYLSSQVDLVFAEGKFWINHRY
ncbi:hypothetical protein HOLleu_02700 [Holothuria leucospilota]|uniref:Ig-like domain-containing protein n=1 Tax=Holothuria leucospilota TaxID=206669 RepID=A0A9Q1CR30_HOLLE|nr:hypothetical protein HOLleu_02700 [Holothuria leucospilota]